MHQPVWLTKVLVLTRDDNAPHSGELLHKTASDRGLHWLPQSLGFKMCSAALSAVMVVCAPGSRGCLGDETRARMGRRVRLKIASSGLQAPV